MKFYSLPLSKKINITYKFRIDGLTGVELGEFIFLDTLRQKRPINGLQKMSVLKDFAEISCIN